MMALPANVLITELHRRYPDYRAIVSGCNRLGSSVVIKLTSIAMVRCRNSVLDAYQSVGITFNFVLQVQRK